MTIEMSDNQQLQISALQELQKKFPFKKEQILAVLEMHAEGCTIPFMARYRKEKTGQLDEVEIKNILDGYAYIVSLENRKEEVLRLIEERGKLTEELAEKIRKAKKLQTVEDLYLPYKEKRRTRATIAKEKGLEPLADWILKFEKSSSLEEAATSYLNEEHELITTEQVLEGAKDIIMEKISEDATIRDYLRQKLAQKAVVHSSLKDEKKDEKGVYKMYYAYDEKVSHAQGYRILAMNRGEKEGALKVSVVAPDVELIQWIEGKYIKHEPPVIAQFVKNAVEEAYKKYIFPAMEREVRKELTEKAEETSIEIFSKNIGQLFMQPPLKNKIVLAVDPAYRTGCKIAVLDETGKVEHIGVIYPHAPKNQWDGAKTTLLELVDKYRVDILAVGNGTASRETEQLVSEVVKESKRTISYLIVNEAGASVYSASNLAREEFPDLQIEERSAISIGRRIQDPLSELVKIDPKSVGVGQYQHDLNQKALSQSLEFVVETAVNKVGVNVNTASVSLLQYVSGLSKTVAKNIVTLRESLGKFDDRKQLKEVPRLGAKTYEQAIGFLRVIDGKNPLDKTGIHPENYDQTKALLKQLGFSVSDIGSEQLVEKLKQLNLAEVAADLEIGLFTLQDIVDALMKPMRDPREALQAPLLRKDVLQIEEIQVGMEFEGTVRNITDFGAFVDIGVKQDGLVHKSKMAKKFVKHPMDIVEVGQIVTVWVDGIDLERGRISLTMNKKEEIK